MSDNPLPPSGWFMVSDGVFTHPATKAVLRKYTDGWRASWSAEVDELNGPDEVEDARDWMWRWEEAYRGPRRGP